ncbi:uncharacterized protein LOC116009722 isoform X1 [Ipomoea triloba]|uniref:uncharacterized protein LOC116009722 isoform X1 n=1 Tax=Ipomoea triloba TaxID=35885 RepID=UPI00125E717A|nr:uncharacterized protein LOC116009722 isoform X1 [Ipomoea triloba]
MIHVEVNEISAVHSACASFMAKNKNTITQTLMKPSTSTCSSSTHTTAFAVINPEVLESGMSTVGHLADYEVWSEHKGVNFPPSTNDWCNRSLNQSGEEKWAKHYSNRHKILLVGEGDFSFSASLAAAFGSASNITATSLDSERGLWKVYDRAVYNIGELMRKGCKVIHGVNAAAMDSHPSLKGLTFDRIIFNFPFAVISKKSKKSRPRPHRVLVKAFMRAAREMICENGEIHITQRTDGILGELKIEFIAFQQWLELVGVDDFNVSDYPGYSPKWETGSYSNADYFPSKTYKFRRSPKIVPLAAATKPANSSAVSVDCVPKFANAKILCSTNAPNFLTTTSNFDVVPPCFEQSFNLAHQHSKGFCYGLNFNLQPEWYPSPSMILPPYGGAAAYTTAEYHHNFLPSSRYCSNYNFLKQNERVQRQVIKTGFVVAEEEKWIKHYSNRHKILLVGEGDFSFSASLAVAFGSATNMTATSLDSEEFLTFHYCKAFLHLKELKKRGCKVIHGVDATSMAYHPSLMGSMFDRIIFNFPYAGFYNDSSRESKIGCHQSMIWMFLENAKQMIGENGEIHITHKTNGFHQQWNIVSLATQQGLVLVGSVKFNVSDYPGYSNKYGFGGDNSFDCSPSKTYMFQHPRTASM